MSASVFSLYFYQSSSYLGAEIAFNFSFGLDYVSKFNIDEF